MTPITRRVLSKEFMDDPQIDRAELAEALRFIRVVNQRLGGTAAALRQFQKWAGEWGCVGEECAVETQHDAKPGDTRPSPQPSPRGRGSVVRIIDIGTGSADIPLAIAEWAKQAGHRVKITAVDLHPTTLALAREHIGERDDIELVQADALKLMEVFESGSFDYAHAGMFLHHLDDLQVMTVLRIMDRLTTRGMIWNDLVRGWIGRLGARLMTLGVPAKLRHDALVSVDAGFTKREVIDLARRVGLQRITYRRHLMHRFTIVAEKSAL